jgi:uncharacterized protein YcbK (DUF882 family)
MSSRRQFLKFPFAAAIAAAAPAAHAAPAAGERALALHNLHTGERLRASYWVDGAYNVDALAGLDRLLRDHRSGEIAAIDPRLFDILHALQEQAGARGAFEVISGYRAPASNARLHASGRGVARDSLHTRGQAIDVRLAGVPLDDLRRAALALRAGGVGYYPEPGFIHLDTGRVRAW